MRKSEFTLPWGTKIEKYCSVLYNSHTSFPSIFQDMNSQYVLCVRNYKNGLSWKICLFHISVNVKNFPQKTEYGLYSVNL
jgi:hypothetical protein